MDRGAWWAAVHGVARVGHGLETKPSPPPHIPSFSILPIYIYIERDVNMCAYTYVHV